MFSPLISMASKKIFTLFFLLSSWVLVGFSELDLTTTILKGDSGSGGNSLAPCIQKLIPCQAYLKPPSNPPASCCLTLKEMIADDPTCLCRVFDDADFLRSLNVTQDEALKLPKACGANADVSECKKLAASPPANSATSSPLPNSTNSNSATSSRSKSAVAYGISSFVGSGFTALFMILIISALQA